MTIKHHTLAYLSALIALAIGARERIWYHLKPLPGLHKIAFALAAGLFVAAATLHSVGLLDDAMRLIGQDWPDY